MILELKPSVPIDIAVSSVRLADKRYQVKIVFKPLNVTFECFDLIEPKAKNAVAKRAVRYLESLAKLVASFHKRMLCFLLLFSLQKYSFFLIQNNIFRSLSQEIYSCCFRNTLFN